MAKQIVEEYNDFGIRAMLFPLTTFMRSIKSAIKS